MKLPLSIYLGLRSTQANLRTTSIVVSSIALAVGVFLAMSSLLFGFRGEFIAKTVNASAHIRLTTESSEVRLQPVYQTERWSLAAIDHIKPPDLPDKIRGAGEILVRLREHPEVTAVSPALTTNVILRYGAVSYPATILGILPDAENTMTGLYEKAVTGNVAELKSQDKGLAMGATIAQKLGVEVGNTIRLTARDGNGYLFRIVAIVRTGITSQDSSRLWVNLKDAQTVAGQYNEITEIGIKIKDYEQAEPLSLSLGQTFGYRAESWQETNSNILGLLVIIFANIFFVLGGLILAAGFGIYNVFSMSVIDRRRDLAIMRTMGVTRNTLVQTFLAQGTVVGIIGGLIGLAIGQLIIEVLAGIKFSTASGQRPVDGDGFTMLQAGWLYASVFGLGMLLAVGSAILPAYRAGGLNPVDVVREAA